MEQVLKELGLYDLTGYLIPGVVVVSALIHVANATVSSLKKDPIKRPVYEIIVVGYITGHLLQAVAAFLEDRLLPIIWQPLFWRPLDQLYAEESAFREALKSAVKNTFANVESSPFILCQTYVRVHGLDAYTDIMQARYAFFRGLTLALFISGCALAYKWFRRRGQAHRGRVLIMSGLLLVATVLSVWRTFRFENYYVDGVYRTFYVATQSNTKTATTPTAR